MIHVDDFSEMGIIILFFAILYLFIQISVFKVKKVYVPQDKINLTRDIKIIQITDYHNNRLINKRRLLRKINKIDPDIIVLTGDIISDDTINFDKTLNFLKKMKTLNPYIYSVSGNHEKRNSLGDRFRECLEEIGIENLEYACKNLCIDENKINLCGIPFNINKKPNDDWFKRDKDSVTVMLSHSPKSAIEYDNLVYDIVLSGHMHGGQVRLPLVGAIVTPYGGLFPKYNKGLYKIDNRYVYVDSGLGNSSYPLRMFNRVQISYIKIANK